MPILTSKTARGTAAVVLDRLRVQYEHMQIVGDARAEIDLRKTTAGRIDLSKSRATISHEAMSGAAAPSRAWWGTLLLEEGWLNLSAGGPTFVGRFDVNCRDARPVSSIFVRDAKVPDFVARVFTMEGLSAEAAVELGPSSIDVHNFVAHGGAFTLEAFFLKRNGKERAALLVETRLLSAVLGLWDGRSSVVLDEPTKWFHATEAAAWSRHPE